MLGRSGAWLKSSLEAVRGSYWFMPTLLVVLAALLAVGITELDRYLSDDVGKAAPWLFARNPDVVQAMLVTIAGSMMTVTGVVFSITVVALTLAASQFGPRLLRNFMHDRGNQLVLGVFLATFVYCVLTLRVVGRASEGGFVPYLAASVAVVLAFVSLCFLIYFIHHIATSLQVTHIAYAIWTELEKSIDVLFPEELGEEPDEAPAEEDPCAGEPAAVACSTRSGYIRILDEDRLLAVARDADVRVRVRRRPGDFTPVGGVLAEVFTDRSSPDGVAGELAVCFAVGDERTPAQDVRFLLNQLNDMALRALSPGINDPRTARICVRYLGAALARIGARRFPSPLRVDEDGRLRVIAPPATFEELVRDSFDSIRIAGRGFPDVAIELLDALAQMAAAADGDERRALLTSIAREVEEDARCHLDQATDRERVAARLTDVRLAPPPRGGRASARRALGSATSPPAD
jgi:uncharacterized membrane protein